MHPCPTLTVSPQARSRSCRSPFPGRLPFWASPFPSRLANASGRIEFIIVLIMDWLFASGCSPPRLSTQLPSATDSQCSVRRGLPPRCWCALSGAPGSDLRADPPTLSRHANSIGTNLLRRYGEPSGEPPNPETGVPAHRVRPRPRALAFHPENLAFVCSARLLRTVLPRMSAPLQRKGICSWLVCFPTRHR
jgi:hypothetical protein